MDLTRRGILQLFGVGALAVPIIGGAPQMEAASRILEIPKIEPVGFQLASIMDAKALLVSCEMLDLVVSFKRPSGKRVVFHGTTFVTEMNTHLNDPGRWDPDRKEYVPRIHGISWNMRGHLTGPWKDIS